MDANYAKACVSKIRSNKDDPESAHSLEDKLYAEFVRHIAGLKIDSVSEIAKEILKTKRIKFARWCA